MSLRVEKLCCYLSAFATTTAQASIFPSFEDYILPLLIKHFGEQWSPFCSAGDSRNIFRLLTAPKIDHSRYVSFYNKPIAITSE